jgi:RNA polymerase sigma-70 factor, ECF subfamily
MAPVSASPDVAAAFKEHRRLLWGLAYRMTGSAADADDVLQETFARAIAHPPPRAGEPLRPWLVQVAINVARDALRRRKRHAYVGPWLPSPVEDAEEGPELPPASTDARYELRESASFAFLVALEALVPQQRAVLLLRDVLDYSVRETAQTLGISEPNVKTTHHRARRAMAAYDVSRRPSMSELAADTRAALERFLSALMMRDAAAAEACLTEGARLVGDGGGEFRTALRPVIGASNITRFFLGLSKKLGVHGRFEIRQVNGLPALFMEYTEPRGERWAPRFVVRCDVNASGMIDRVYVISASKKLSRIAASLSHATAPTSLVSQRL